MLTRRAALAAFCGAARFRFLAQGNPLNIELPARLNAENGLLIPARVNGGTQLWWLLDTGGGTLLYLNPLIAADLGIMPSFSGRSAGGLDPVLKPDRRALVTLDVGSAHVKNRQLVIKESISVDAPVIGAAVFAESIIELDFQRPIVRLHPGTSFRYEGSGAAVPFDLWENNPHVLGHLTIDDRDPVRARMTIDTGALGSTAYLTPRFCDKLRHQGRSLTWIRGRNGFSACRIDHLAVGRFTMERPIVHLLPDQGFGGKTGAPDALLAIGFLKRYRIFLDYAKKMMILEPLPPRGEAV